MAWVQLTQVIHRTFCVVCSNEITCTSEAEKPRKQGSNATWKVFVNLESLYKHRKFPGHLETFQAIWKLSMPSRNCPGHLETVQIIWNLSRPSGNFPDHLETFQAIWKLSRPPENCPDHLKTFQTIWKLSRPSGRFPDHPEAFQNIRPSVKAGWEFFSIFRNFPGFQFGPFQCSYGQIKQFTVIVCFIAIT